VAGIDSSCKSAAAAVADSMLPTAAAAIRIVVIISKPHSLDCRLLPWGAKALNVSRHLLLLLLLGFAKELF
jgi:hypothetical protein